MAHEMTSQDRPKLSQKNRPVAEVTEVCCAEDKTQVPGHQRRGAFTQLPTQTRQKRCSHWD